MTILLTAAADAAALGTWCRLLQAALPDERIVTDRSAVSAAGIDVANVRRLRAGVAAQNLVDRARGYSAKSEARC